MCGLMTARVELWPMAADATGIWLLGSEQLMSPPIPQDSDPHYEVEALLRDQAAALIHSTSWRAEGPHIVLTYVAVLGSGVDVDVPVRWPAARPISRALLEAVGPVEPNAAHEAPLPSHAHVMAHGVRHLRFLLDHDATAAAALDRHWREHLGPLQPALAGMYAVPHQAA